LSDKRSNGTSTSAAAGHEPAEHNKPDVGTKVAFIAGLGLVYLGGALFVLIAVRWLFMSPPDQEVRFLQFVPALIVFCAGIFTAALGVGLVRGAGLSTILPKAVINPHEWADLREEIIEGNEEAMTQYIRLTSLSGFTGFFTKLGLQGLPLATIGLTVFFALLALLIHEPQGGYMDMAKLTLGAFIGSFVQKQIAASQSGGTIKLPTGERINIPPPAAPTSV
jgi:hypothetical protein